MLTVSVLVVIAFVPSVPDVEAEIALEHIEFEYNRIVAASERFKVTTGVCELFGDVGEMDV